MVGALIVGITLIAIGDIMAVHITGTLGALTPTITLGLVAGAEATGVAVIGEVVTGVAVPSSETTTTDLDHLEWVTVLQDHLLEDT